jgi:hypothetical protein
MLSTIEVLTVRLNSISSLTLFKTIIKISRLARWLSGYSSLKENVPHGNGYLNTWYPLGGHLGMVRRRGLAEGGVSLGVGSEISEPCASLGGVALLKEVCQ